MTHLAFLHEPKWAPIRIAGLYLVLGCLWIAFSDRWMAKLTSDPDLLIKISLYKGWGFIFVTTLLLSWQIWRFNRTLNKKEELLELTGHIAKVGGWEIDTHTFQGTWTDEVARIHGLDPGLPVNVELGLSLYQGESRKRIEEAIKNAVESAQSYDLELEMVSAKGEHKWVRTIGVPVLENEKVIRVRGIFQDITARKITENSLKENEERFRSLYENATIGMYRTTPDGRILLCNPALVNMLGYKSLDELTHLNLEAEGYEPSYTRSEFRQRIEQLGEVRGFESAWIKQDGATLFVRESAKAIKDTDGNVLFYEGTVEDITERKRSEEALRLENERFTRFIESNIVGIIIADAQGNIILTNDYFLNILGVTRQDLLDGKVQWTEFTPPEWLPLDEKAIGELRESGASEPYEKEYERTDGARIPVYIANTLLPGPDEKIAAFVVDISKRKQIEEKLKRSNIELEQFAYLASHDLQEPLRAITGMVQLLQQRFQGKLDEQADEYFSHMVDASRRMQTLINDLLTYSRVDRRVSHFELVNFESVLSIVMANLQVAIEESQAKITHDPLPILSADKMQISQVLQNLIGNAIKFRGTAPLQIHIGAKEIENGWQFEVRDNGIGIEPQYFERIFKVFQRLHTRQEYPGTGIGLSLCKKFVEQHGGRIWVDANAGAGSIFYFTIPDRR